MNFSKEYLGNDLLIRRKEIDKAGVSKKDFFDIIKSKIDKISSEEKILSIINNNGNVKLGIDPTGSDIHLGHAVTLNMLRLAKNVGLNPIFIIGTLTAQVGDPTGRVNSRPVLTKEDINKNITTYKEQAGKIIDLNSVNIIYNDKLNKNVSIIELMNYFSNISMSTLLQRDDFRSRLGDGGVTMAEVSYPLLMGLDSIKISKQYGENLLELGGKDQLLNFQLTKDIMKKQGINPQEYITSILLPGTNSIDSKMSKSLGNYIGLNESSKNIFGKIMSIPDNLILTYYLAFGDIFSTEKRELEKFISKNPYEAKKQLAFFITSIISGENNGEKEIINFEKQFGQKEFKKEDFKLINYKNGDSIVDLLFNNGDFKSKNFLRTLLKQGSIKIIKDFKETKEKIKDENIIFKENTYIKIGKKNPQLFLLKITKN